MYREDIRKMENTITPLTRVNHWFVVVQSLSCVSLFATPGTEACQAFLSFPISWSLLRLMSIESVMPSNHLILCRPLLLLPSIFPSISVFFQWVGSSHQVAKVLELQLQPSVLPVNIQGWFPLGLAGLISPLVYFLLKYTQLKHVYSFKSCF